MESDLRFEWGTADNVKWRTEAGIKVDMIRKDNIPAKCSLCEKDPEFVFIGKNAYICLCSQHYHEKYGDM